jgi:hypothetical protein
MLVKPKISANMLVRNIDAAPPGAGNGVTSPVGEQAAQLAAIKISEGFNLGYCKAKPGHGPMMHNHDTNETFIPMTGRWRASWENETGEVDHVDLDPLDVISFPPGLIRRFENVTPGDPDAQHILMFVIGGDPARVRTGGVSRVLITACRQAL